MSEPAAIGLVLDCHDLDGLATFWSAALDYTYVGSAENYAMLVPTDRSGPKLLLQRVAETKSTKNRMHLDLETADIDVLATKLETLGATRAESDPYTEMGHRWVVMADPEGNEFCICECATTPDA